MAKGKKDESLRESGLTKEETFEKEVNRKLNSALEDVENEVLKSL